MRIQTFPPFMAEITQLNKEIKACTSDSMKNAQLAFAKSIRESRLRSSGGFYHNYKIDDFIFCNCEVMPTLPYRRAAIPHHREYRRRASGRSYALAIPDGLLPLHRDSNASSDGN